MIQDFEHTTYNPEIACNVYIERIHSPTNFGEIPFGPVQMFFFFVIFFRLVSQFSSHCANSTFTNFYDLMRWWSCSKG